MIYLINYDAGNLLSIQRALKFLNFDFLTISKVKDITNKDILLIPGVGSFDSASKKISESGLLEIVQQSPSKRPFILGICLGMQLLMTSGYEGKPSKGLDIIKGSVESIQSKKPIEVNMQRTLIGWQEFRTKSQINEKYQFLNKFQNQSFYHVHSFMCIPDNPEDIIATYNYELSFIPNIIGNLNNKVLGFQFHPEKSGPIGLKLLKMTIETLLVQ